MATVHRISYSSPTRIYYQPPEADDAEPGSTRPSKQKSKLHWLRDGDAGSHYVAKLAAAGYGYRQEFNAPPPPEWADCAPDRAAAAQERLKKGDVILVNNRPPLTPDMNHLLAPIVRSGSWVEDRIMDAVGRCFAVCSRDEVVLTDELAAMLPPRFAKRAKLKFKTRAEAEYTCRASQGGVYEEIASRRTAGYLIYAREIWPNGPDLLCSFAMSGPMNLAWAFLITTRFADHVLPTGRERVLIADIIPDNARNRGRVFPEWTDTLDFTSSWKVEPTLDRCAPRLWL